MKNTQAKGGSGRGGLEGGRQRSFGSYCNEEQAHFGPPGTGPLPGEAFYYDERFYGSQSGSGGVQGTSGWYKGGAGGGLGSEFEEDGFGVTSFSDEDVEDLDLR